MDDPNHETAQAIRELTHEVHQFRESFKKYALAFFILALLVALGFFGMIR